MKEILILSILFFSVDVHGQTDTSEVQLDTTRIKIIQPSDSTAIGTPDGKLVAKEIGPAGGTIVSEDGRVELIFPVDALTANTTISIQPTTNLAPNGAGKAYQFEPSGIQFNKPVEIIFHYTDEEAEICPPELMGLAMQDHTGKWRFDDYEDWDSTAKTLKGLIHHFSYFTNINKLYIDTRTGKVRVNDQVSIDVFDIAERTPTWFDLAIVSKETAWYVNGILNGNSEVGTMRSEENYLNAKKFSTDDIKKGWGKQLIGIYKARNNLPAKNPVTVKLAVKYYSKKWKKLVWSSCKCEITVYDEYKVKVSMNLGKGSGMEWIDSSTFLVKIDNQVKIYDVQNMMLKVIFGKLSCKYTFVNESSCTGLINISGINATKLNAAISPQQPYIKVDIYFKLAPAIGPIFTTSSCKGIPPTPTPGFFSLHAFPIMISFEAKNERQLISLAKGNGTVVKKADPDDITATIEPVRNDSNQ